MLLSLDDVYLFHARTHATHPRKPAGALALIVHKHSLIDRLIDRHHTSGETYVSVSVVDAVAAVPQQSSILCSEAQMNNFTASSSERVQAMPCGYDY